MIALNDWRKRICIDPKVHHGDPCIAGTRVPVSVVVGSVADGDSFEQILASYPKLAREDFQAALRFSEECTLHGKVQGRWPEQLPGSDLASEGISA